jgi:hypothetical protein
VKCAQSACRGTLTLEASLGAKLASIHGKPTKLMLGRSAFSLKPGERKRCGVKLRRVGLKLLQRRGKLRARAILVVHGGKRTARAVVLVARSRR